MSEIPLHKRKKSPLDVQHNINKIRREITLDLMETFGYSKQKFERHIRKATAFIKDDEDRQAREDQLRQREEGFDVMFIEHERVRILDLVCEISTHIRRANTIYPTYMCEWMERRMELTRAMEACNALQDELQYIAETLPADKNKYMNIVLELEGEYRGIRALRQSNNRLLKGLKDYSE